MGDYYFNKEQFVIDNYLKHSAFSNFLPGLAGKKGIPLWAFYVNRGQGISGFGLQDKNHPIMEFTPANKAYESVGQIGFRSFLKVDGVYYEPFRPNSGHQHKMLIDRHSFTIEEVNDNLGVKISITYFGLPNENLGALARRATVTNLTNKSIEIEWLDGIAEILPAGIQNQEFKAISNLLCSWMDVDDLDRDFAFYRLRSSTGDSSMVTEITSGNFLFGILNQSLVKPITDSDLVFGMDSSKQSANYLIEHGIESILKQPQVTANKIPCGFIPVHQTLHSSNSIQIDILVGHTHSKAQLEALIQTATTPKYLDQKQVEAKAIIDEMVNDVSTDTSFHIFNEYIKQNYLDNLLRGGYPIPIGDTVYHLFSRRHGDLERDYNFFSLAPEFYSQGSGNFRDVCQNRRMDSFIHPEVGSHNIKHFASLIQLDGYNPLTVHGSTFEIEEPANRERLVKRFFGSHQRELQEFLGNRFSPGGLVNTVANWNVEVKEESYLDEIIQQATEHIESAFGEGYWVDHFTYILDLVDSYEAIFPDKVEQLLFDENDILTFESPVTVLGKSEKTVLTKEGKVRQYGSLLHFDEDKIEQLRLNRHGTNWVRVGNKLYKTNLFVKLFLLVLNKHAALDNEGIGIEMEAEKPGWNDAMNGLPGLFGSGVSETIELKRIIEFLLKYFSKQTVILPNEVHELFYGLLQARNYQERVSAKETYRETVRFGLSGEFVSESSSEIKEYLQALNDHIQMTLETLYDENEGIIPTFIVYDVKEYQEIRHQNAPVYGKSGLEIVNPLGYQKRYLPKFLEAPARLLKLDFDTMKLKKMVNAIKESPIYDRNSKLYKTSEPLDTESYEIGRIRAFTPGWLERESDFLHMIYKYLFGLLKAGLYEEFYTEIKDNFVCFMDPAVYGRNPLENSSFIAPSNNPNPLIHGKGFLPRLSGSTVEVLDIWRQMMTGGYPFVMEHGKLVFRPQPKIAKEFFKENHQLEFTFLRNTKMVYVNENQKDTYTDCEITKIELFSEAGKETFYQSYLDGIHAYNVRECLYNKIVLYIK